MQGFACKLDKNVMVPKSPTELAPIMTFNQASYKGYIHPAKTAEKLHVPDRKTDTSLPAPNIMLVAEFTS